MTYLQRIFIRNLLYVLLPVLICVLLTGAVFGQNYYQQTVETSRAATADVLTQSMDAIESWLNHVNTIAIELSFRKETYYDLMELFNKPYLNNFEKRTLTDMMATVNATMSANTAIKSIYVYLENDRKNFYATGEETVVNIDSYYDTDWYDVYCSLEDTKSLYGFVHNVLHYDFEGPRATLTVMRKMPSHSGVVVLNVDTKVVDTYMRALHLASDSTFVIRNNNNEYYRFSRNVQTEYAEELVVKSLSYPWEYVIYISNTLLQRQIFITLRYTLLLSAISLLAGLGAASILTWRRHKKFRLIDELFKNEGLEIDEKSISATDEYGFISANIASMLLEMDKRKYMAEILQLEAAQYQLTPHFLFNTLENIYFECLDLTGGENEASIMLSRLSLILKYSLRFPNEEVTVSKEVEISQIYSEIMDMRDYGKFTVRFESTQESLDCALPKLFLQPLIENSIYHGAKEKEGLTTITVSAKTQGGRLLIDVCDDGAGMDAAQVEEVDHDMRSSSRKHIGLGNIYRRLETLYHDDFQMSIHINQTGGITVSINIPARKNT